MTTDRRDIVGRNKEEGFLLSINDRISCKGIYAVQVLVPCVFTLSQNFTRSLSLKELVTALDIPIFLGNI